MNVLKISIPPMEEIIALLAQPPFTLFGNSNQISCIFSNYLVFEKPPHLRNYNPSVRAGEYGDFLDMHILKKISYAKRILKLMNLLWMDALQEVIEQLLCN